MPPGKRNQNTATIKRKQDGKAGKPLQPPNQTAVVVQGPDMSQFPILQAPVVLAKPSDPKKWCVRFNVPIHKPSPEYYVDGKRVDPAEKTTFFLQKDTVVRIIDHRPGWSGIAFERTLFRNIDLFKKGWVTIRLAGWVEDQYLDDYYAEFPNFDGVEILQKNQSLDSSDAEQDLILGKDQFTDRKYNLCGEFSLAYAAHRDIDTVVNTWRDKSRAIYESMIGAGHDKPLGQSEIDDILTKVFGDQIKWEHYVPDPPAVKIPLAAENDLRRASIDLQNRLKGHYLITNVRINTHTGELVRKGDDERNHWIVLDKITHQGRRVELYNPFPNARQSYSFGEFYNSVGSNPNRGWWIQKNPSDTASEENSVAQEEKDEVIVAIDNATLSTIDAEQYAFIEGEPTKKNMLCGEFSVTYILTQSLERNLANWLASHADAKPELPELVRILYAYGFNHRKYVVEDPSTGLISIKLDLDSDREYFKSFSIDTVLKYWKAVQPKLYESILGDRHDTGTGPEDLKTILKAYGYITKDPDKDKLDVRDYLNDTRNGERLRPPGRDHEELKTNYLIACVRIETEKGALIPGSGGGKKTALHWVVVTNITPFGSQAGGNSGWVELYNPFTNRLEEYSYKEFSNSYSAPAIWVKREITPTFSHQTVKLFRDGDLEQASGLPSTKKKVETKAWTTEKLLDEIKKMRSKGKTDQQLPALLFGKNTGWSKDALDALVAKQSPKPADNVSQSKARLGKMLLESLNLKEDLPEEIISLISKASREDAGDDDFALEVVNALRELGFLLFTKVEDAAVQNKKGQKPQQILSFQDTPLPPKVSTNVSIAGPSVGQLEKMEQTVRAQAEQSLRLQRAAMDTAHGLTDKIASAVGPLCVTPVQEEIKNIRLGIAVEQQANKKDQTGNSAAIHKVSPYTPTYRVMWDWEGWAVGAKKINRPELPCVFRCGDIKNPNNAPFIDLTEEWQFFWFDLCCWVYYGRYHQDLTDEEYKWLANKWTSVGDSKRAFTNGQGLERYRNFVLKERLNKNGLPKLQTLVCGGASLAGTPVPTSGNKSAWMLKVAHFDGNRPPPDVRTIDPYTDPRVFFATTIAYDKKPGYTITFDAVTGPPKPKTLTIKDDEAFATGRFPQFDLEDPKTHEITLIDCPIPIIATEDIFYPMRFLVPITDGKKANPYYPAKEYTGFGRPEKAK